MGVISPPRRREGRDQTFSRWFADLVVMSEARPGNFPVSVSKCEEKITARSRGPKQPWAKSDQQS